MESAINWHDFYTLEKDRIVYTDEQLHIPGVHVLAHQILRHTTYAHKWHYHENSFEFTVAAQGIFTYSTISSSYQFSGEDVFIAFPSEIHGTNRVPVSMGKLYWFQLDTSDENHFLFMNPDAARETIAQLNAIPHHVIQAKNTEIQTVLRRAFQCARSGESPQLVASYLQLFLHLVISYSQKENSTISSDIEKTLQYIQAHITNELSLEELAALVNLSCSQYKQKFKKQMGISPRRFINQQKIEAAKSLLLKGMSVTDIAMQLGFNSSTYFSTVFKQYTLYTPRDYIKTAMNDPSCKNKEPL